MDTVKKIFLADVKHICKSFFALVVAIGVLILPALYAWFNIMSNWDPYGNTKGLQLAAVSLDQGYTDDDGTYRNVGDDVMEDLAASEAITWTFLQTEDEVLEGVENGTYYAGLVIPADFTYNMYNIFLKDVDKPTMIFYQNQKKNPVATKITDTVISNVENNIQEEYINVLTTAVFKDVNELSDDIDEDGGIDGLLDQMKEIDEEIQGYESTIDSVMQGNEVLRSALNEASDDTTVMKEKSDSAAKSIDESNEKLADSQVTLDSYSKEIDSMLGDVEHMLADMEYWLKQGTLTTDVKAMYTAASNAQKDLNQITTDLDALASSVQASGAASADQLEAIAAIHTMSETIAQIQSAMNQLDIDGQATTTEKQLEQSEANMAQSINTMLLDVQSAESQLNNNLIPEMNNLIDSLETILDDASSMMRQMSNTMLSMGDVFDALEVTVDTSNTSLIKTRDALDTISGRLEDTISKVEKAEDDEKVQILMDTLSGDPEMYGEFFSEPVKMDTEAVYPVENYGSSVTPFYTVLALWVGVIILCAILKTHPNPEVYGDAKPWELFIGRYQIFFVMGQLQALVTVLGDLYYFKVQCLHPVMFWFASAVASMVFTMFIYSLVYSFGDVGKALSVVIVVLQIAGSSGTYPIELLPDFFQKVYRFFPFPYAINAMRETIGGLYEADYLVYLLELMIFFGVGLVIGIWIRVPFEELHEYMEKRMEDTELM